MKFSYVRAREPRLYWKCGRLFRLSTWQRSVWRFKRGGRRYAFVIEVGPIELLVWRRTR